MEDFDKKKLLFLLKNTKHLINNEQRSKPNYQGILSSSSLFVQWTMFFKGGYK